MRILLLLMALTLTGSLIHAQTERGDWVVGGNFSLNTTDDNTQIALSPTAGVFVINNLAFGGNLLIDHSKVGNNKRTDFGIGPFLRFYFTNANVRPIIHGNLNFISSKNKTQSISNTENGISYFLGGGAAIFISEQVSIDGLMGYAHSKYKDHEGNGGFALFIGFQVYLLKRQMDKVRGR